MVREKKKEYKIWVSMRNEEINQRIRAKLIRCFGSVSNGAFTILHCFLEPEYYHNIFNLEQVKLESEVMRFRNEQLKQLDRENKLLSRRLIEIEKELEKYKNHQQIKGAIK